MSLTSPLGLVRHARRPDLRLEVVPWLNVLLLGGALALLSSNFIYAPGLTIGLGEDPSVPGAAPVKLPGNLTLPKLSGTPPGQPVAEAITVVLKATNNQVFLFEGGIYFNLKALGERLKHHQAPPKGQAEVLLLKMSKEVTVQTLAEISDLARKAGYTDVQVAVESESAMAPRPEAGTPAPANGSARP